MNYFIDLGCGKGETIEEFNNWKVLFNQEPFKIYGFDPNPGFSEEWAKMRKERPEVKLIQAAAWTKDGKIDFSSHPNSESSSIMKEKNTYKDGKIITVPCFDFSFWLKSIIKPNDFVLVKMDIEGAEMELLPKMIKEGTDELISILLVEWHDYKMDRESNKRWIWDNLKCTWYHWR